MLITANFSSNSPFIPKLNVPLEKSSIPQELVGKLKKIMLDEEKYIMETYPAFGGGMVDKENGLEDWITNRAFEYNLLKFADKYPELNELKDHIANQYKNYVTSLNFPEEKVYIQVWINILYKDSRHFTSHHHAHESRIGDQSYAYVSGNICIDAEDTNTYYIDPFLDTRKITIKNIAGESILFPSWVLHSTDQNQAETPRLSIAFDIITEFMYNQRQMDNPDNYIRLN
jgi:hypothetical protein